MSERMDDERRWSERIEELRDRIGHVVRQIDLRGRIDDNPWAAVGIAAALGAWLGFSPPRMLRFERSARNGFRAKLADALLAAVGAVAVRLVREAAFRQLGDVAKRWWEDSAQVRPGQVPAQH